MKNSTVFIIFKKFGISNDNKKKSQSAWALEYTDCIYADEYPTSTSVLDMTLNNQMMRPRSWSFGKCGVPLYCHCSLVRPGSER